MEEIVSVAQKRPRDELEGQVDFEECSNTKRNKPYNHILTILESEEEESTQDLSPLMTTLQQEITSTPSNNNNNNNQSQGNDQNTLHKANQDDQNTLTSIHQEEEDDKEKVMRHLLQASDDELGIPSSGDENGSTLDFGEFGFISNNNGEYGEGENNNNNGFSSLCDNLWELEDEAANYYTLLQSELFLWE